MKKHNFYAGPSILSPYTIQKTADAVLNFADTGLSVLEVSHRSKEFQAVIDEAQALTKELLQLPSQNRRIGGGLRCGMRICEFQRKRRYPHNSAQAKNRTCADALCRLQQC